MKIRNIILGGGLLLATAMGCAKFVSTSSNEQSLMYIEAWLGQNHPDARKSGNGIYILSETPGTGEAYDGEDYIMIRYTISTMDGTIQSTNDVQLSQQIGTYDPTANYEDRVWYTEGTSIQVGLEDLITGMRKGGTRKALIPGWLMVSERQKNPEAYFEQTENIGNTAIYEITITDFTDKIVQWEIDRIEDFNLRYFGEKVDSTSYGYYYKQLKAPTSDKAYSNTDYFYVNYTGRLLNGQVFDTTIRDTAKKYNLYNASKTYEPVKIQLAEQDSDIQMTVDGNAGSVIAGVQKIVKQLKPYERGVGVFISNFGYGTSSSGSINAFTPLAFDIEVTDKPE